MFLFAMSFQKSVFFNFFTNTFAEYYRFDISFSLRLPFGRHYTIVDL